MQPLTLFHVPKPRVSSEQATNKTRQTRSHEIAQFRRHVSGPGSSSESIQLQHELKEMSCDERESLLLSLKGQQTCSTEVSADQILAMKATLSIPWNKLRTMRRL